jgi:aminopeptidase YwaD
MKIRMIILLWLTITTIGAQTLNLSKTLRDHVTILASDSLAGRGFGFPEKHLAIDYITGQFRETGFSSLYDNYLHLFNHPLSFAMIEGKNIIAVIEGSDPDLKNEYILIGAHYDHMGWKNENSARVVYNGADDNASGTATIIEVGKLLMANREKLGRSIIIVAFDGEEAGLIGSTALTTDEYFRELDLKLMFSLDMVGMLAENNGIEFTGFKSFERGEEIAADVALRNGITIKKTDNKIETNTDTWPFGKLGIPAVAVTTGLISPYHKPEDDSHLLDYEGMAKIVLLITDLSIELSNIESITADRHFITRSVNPVLRPGFNFGYGAASHMHSGEFYKARAVFSFEAGVNVQLKLSNRLRITPAIMYTKGGSKSDSGTLRTHSVTPRIDMLLTTRSESFVDPVGFLLVGTSYDYIFRGTEAKSESAFANRYKSKDLGLRFGVGIILMNTQMSITYRHGLTQINRNESDGKIFNRGFLFSTTSFF